MIASMSTRDRRWVAARRAAVRALHPDRGGDPDAFIAALANVDTTYGYLPGCGRREAALIVIVRHARWRRVTTVIDRAVRRVAGTRHDYADL